jgi:drug/metabolite transporter (DMT)-like permease
MKMDRSILLILVAMVLGAVGQIFLKMGMNRVGAVEIDFANLVQGLLPMFMQPLVWAGLAFYGISSVVWLIVLSRFDLSFAYPMLASMYVILPVLSYIFLDESIPPLRWFGMVIVLVGVVLVSRG